MRTNLTATLRRGALWALLPALLMLFSGSEASGQKVKAWDIKYDLVMSRTGASEMSSEEKAYLEMAAMMVTGGTKETILQILVAEDYIRVAEKGLLGNKVSVAGKSDSVYYMLDADAGTATAYPAGLPKIDTHLVGDSVVVVSSDDFTFEFTNERKKIAGYRCKKVIMHNTADTVGAGVIEIWYTDKLPKTYWGDYGYLEKVPGAALAVLTNASGYNMGIQARKVKKTKAVIADFMVPAGYTIQDDLPAYAQDSVYDYVGPYADGLAVVSLDYKYGYINENREEVIPLKYEYAGDFDKGFAMISLDLKYGLIDSEGKEVVPPKYDIIQTFSDGLVAVLSGNKYGYLDTTGKLVVPFKYDIAYDFKEGFAQVMIGDKYGFIDTRGRSLTPLKYELAYDFSEGMACVWVNGKCGFIDKSGKEIIPVQYEWADNFQDGKAQVQLGNQKFKIDKTGKKIK